MPKKKNPFSKNKFVSSRWDSFVRAGACVTKHDLKKEWAEDKSWWWSVRLRGTIGSLEIGGPLSFDQHDHERRSRIFQLVEEADEALAIISISAISSITICLSLHTTLQKPWSPLHVYDLCAFEIEQ